MFGKAPSSPELKAASSPLKKKVRKQETERNDQSFSREHIIDDVFICSVCLLKVSFHKKSFPRYWKYHMLK
jgi:hypothetical protein